MLAASLAAGACRAAAPCGPAVVAAILEPAREPDEPVELACDLTLRPTDRVTKRIVLQGDAASGTTLDCRGATIGRPEAQPTFPNPTVAIRSVARTRDGRTVWDRPSDVTIRNCTVAGPIRVYGMGLNGQAEPLKLSSRSLGHTERAQAAAPTRITIEGSRLVASGGTPLYLGPGVTEATLRDSVVTGRAVAIGVYLDAESARNTLRGNTFAVETGREVVAVDGSAFNTVVDNTFRSRWQGGIYLYRNCGEGGTIRHQTPSHNVIRGNRFHFAWPVHFPAVKIGAREGWNLYCAEDAGYPFGSSADDGDRATDNVDENNVVE